MDDRTGSPAALAAALASTGYLADDDLATAAFLALKMHRPLFCEGEPGTGKTALAQALATVLDAELIRLQCYEGIDASQALYDWDFPRQLLHLRALEATGGAGSTDDVEASLYDRRFLLARPILRALQSPRAVLLVDEIDRADDEFEAFLLEVLTEHAVSIPELGEVRADVPPVVVLTSNRTREVHDALKRRCLYLWLDHPDVAREIEILHARIPGLPERLAAEVAAAAHRLREADLLKPPGVAESLDWARALQLVGARHLDIDSAAATLGAVLKYREDADRVRARLDTLLGRPVTGPPTRSRPRARARRVHRRAAPRRPAGHHRAGHGVPDRRRRPGHRARAGVPRRAAHPVRRPRRPAALRARLRRLVRRRPAPRRGTAPQRPADPAAVVVAALRDDATAPTATTAVRRCGRAPRAPRCCATTTSASCR